MTLPFYHFPRGYNGQELKLIGLHHTGAEVKNAWICTSTSYTIRVNIFAACFLGLVFDRKDESSAFPRSVGQTSTRVYGVRAQKLVLFVNTVRRLSEALHLDRANKRRHFVYLYASFPRMYGENRQSRGRLRVCRSA
jgi:hypothetical protein